MVFGKKKGQIFMQYLADYCWLFLLTMVIIAVLSYCGFYTFGIFGRMKCTLSQGFICREPTLKKNEFSLVLQSRQSTPITIKSVVISAGQFQHSIIYENPEILYFNQKQKIILQSEDIPEVVKGNLIISYESANSGLSFKEVGDIYFMS